MLPGQLCPRLTWCSCPMRLSSCRHIRQHPGRIKHVYLPQLCPLSSCVPLYVTQFALRLIAHPIIRCSQAQTLADHGTTMHGTACLARSRSDTMEQSLMSRCSAWLIRPCDVHMQETRESLGIRPGGQRRDSG